MKGFTLIELIVTVSIILIVTVSVMVNYFQFDARQKLTDEARSLVTIIDKARTKAIAMEYPTGCTGLLTYNIKSVTETGEIETMAKCTSGNSLPEKERVLVSTELVAPLTIDFEVQSGKIVTGENVVIVLENKDNANLSKTITVDANLIDKTTIVP